MSHLKLTPFRTEIVKYIGKRKVQKAELVEQYKDRYESKPAQNLGRVLRPMVKQRILQQPKKGIYERGNRRVKFFGEY